MRVVGPVPHGGSAARPTPRRLLAGTAGCKRRDRTMGRGGRCRPMVPPHPRTRRGTVVAPWWHPWHHRGTLMAPSRHRRGRVASGHPARQLGSLETCHQPAVAPARRGCANPSVLRHRRPGREGGDGQVRPQRAATGGAASAVVECARHILVSGRTRAECRKGRFAAAPRRAGLSLLSEVESGKTRTTLAAVAVVAAADRAGAA
jgi:hypothetical protein